LWLAPTQASAANCSFSKKEKIAMVSWIMLIPGAVITGIHTELRFLDRRRRAI
jgi:hypothetical protein